MSEGGMDSEEEDTPVVGGEGFTSEELAQAEQNFTAQLVGLLSTCLCIMSTATACMAITLSCISFSLCR